MNLKCLGYLLFDRVLRRTPIGTFAFYKGTKVQVLQNDVTYFAEVTSRGNAETDGDLTFNITILDDVETKFRHCEITPCASQPLKEVGRQLKVGQLIHITGDERFDPPHLDGGGWLEIHPVKDIKVYKNG